MLVCSAETEEVKAKNNKQNEARPEQQQYAKTSAVNRRFSMWQHYHKKIVESSAAYEKDQWQAHRKSPFACHAIELSLIVQHIFFIGTALWRRQEGHVVGLIACLGISLLLVTSSKFLLGSGKANSAVRAALFLALTAYLLLSESHWALFGGPLSFLRLQEGISLLLHSNKVTMEVQSAASLLVFSLVPALLLSFAPFFLSRSFRAAIRQRLYACIGTTAVLGTIVFYPGAFLDTPGWLIYETLSYNAREGARRISKHVPVRALIGEKQSAVTLRAGLNAEYLGHRPDIIVVEWESTSALYLSLFHAEGKIKLPHLERLASNGLIMNRHYSVNGGSSTNCDWAIMTGLYPLNRGLYQVANFDRLQEKSILYYLKKFGYETAVYQIGNGENYNIERIYQTDFTDSYKDLRTVERGGGSKLDVEKIFLGNFEDQLIHRPTNHPLYVHFRADEPHWPYDGVGASDFERYAYGVEKADQFLGKILDIVERRSNLADTVILLTSDHGEAFGQHNINVHSNHIFEELVRVPFVISYPRFIKQPLRIEDPTSHVDILPTLLDIIGVTEDKHELDGYSLLRELPVRRTVFLADSADGRITGLVRGHDKFGIDHMSGDNFLFDLKADPLERREISRSSAALAVALRNIHDIWQAHATIGIASSRYPRESATSGSGVHLALGTGQIKPFLNGAPLYRINERSLQYAFLPREGDNELILQLDETARNANRMFFAGVLNFGQRIVPGTWWQRKKQDGSWEAAELLFPESGKLGGWPGSAWMRIHKDTLAFRLQFRVSAGRIESERVRFQCDDTCTVYLNGVAFGRLENYSDVWSYEFPRQHSEIAEILVELENFAGRGGMLFDSEMNGRLVSSSSPHWKSLADMSYEQWIKLKDRDSLPWSAALQRTKLNGSRFWPETLDVLWNEQARDGAPVLFRYDSPF